MRPSNIAGLLAAVSLVFVTVAGAQAPTDFTRVIQWLDSAAGLTHYTSSQYPLPVRPPPLVHTSLPNAVLTSSVAQVVIPAGSIVNGCDVTFANAYGDYYLAYTDPSAPTVPTAAAPAGIAPGTTGRGLHLQMGGGFSTSRGYVYHCPGPTNQGISVLFVSNPGNSAGTSNTVFVSADIY